MKLAIALVGLLCVATATPASADPITYTFSATFSGTENGNPFSTTGTLTGIGDTGTMGNGFGNPNIVGVPLSSTQLTLGGTVYAVTQPTFFYTYAAGLYSNTDGRVGISFDGGGGNYVGLEGMGYNGYNGVSDLSAVGTSYGALNANFSTDLGPLVISAATAASFAAAVDAAPEPASWALMILGFGTTGTVLRRRRRPEPNDSLIAAAV